jgi:hypothetical protein
MRCSVPLLPLPGFEAVSDIIRDSLLYLGLPWTHEVEGDDEVGESRPIHLRTVTGKHGLPSQRVHHVCERLRVLRESRRENVALLQRYTSQHRLPLKKLLVPQVAELVLDEERGDEVTELLRRRDRAQRFVMEHSNGELHSLREPPSLLPAVRVDEFLELFWTDLCTCRVDERMLVANRKRKPEELDRVVQCNSFSSRIR